MIWTKNNPSLVELAKIVRGADTPNRNLTPLSEGLVAVAIGFSIISNDDHDIWQNNSMFTMLYMHFADLQQQRRILLPVVTNNKT